MKQDDSRILIRAVLTFWIIFQIHLDRWREWNREIKYNMLCLCFYVEYDHQPENENKVGTLQSLDLLSSVIFVVMMTGWFWGQRDRRRWRRQLTVEHKAAGCIQVQQVGIYTINQSSPFGRNCPYLNGNSCLNKPCYLLYLQSNTFVVLNSVKTKKTKRTQMLLSCKTIFMGGCAKKTPNKAFNDYHHFTTRGSCILTSDSMDLIINQSGEND